ncbi:uncharacterized protein LOC111921312 [Lactuca sativa]|uniref:SWIM-type domain-containing protein n=1 Tax=Lactuca sativa TaxID=4236 RepID=A0A9R1UJ44_LACSA|nr:uncharacterized protein LOC111921312 [Lactuca sativa]KAJ0188420.1 hypothetical protein LSAT_V11C900472610 [Lactuca sativa]
MKYSTTVELKYSLSCYAVANGYDLWYEKNDKTRLLVRCCKGKHPTCPFRLYASWMKEEHTFQIKSLITEHKCSRAFKLGSIVTYKWIGKQFVNDVLESPKLSLRKMKALVSKRYNINVSVGQCRNVKKLALSEVERSLKEHYAKLWDYAAEIRKANPGSHVEVFLEPQPDNIVVFDRFYVSFKGVVDGWLDGCRKVIGVDGCFLKGVCRGELLSTVGRDANNNIYPLDWAVVNVENKRTWKWFLDNLMEDIGGGNGHGITILSDGHKGLFEAVKERLPDVEHRLCARHILANFHKKFKGEQYFKPFWRVVNATTVPKFEAAMNEIESLESMAYDYLIERDPRCWSKAFFREGMDCDAVENGVSESFNSVVLDARRKPLITMLEDIRCWAMQRLWMQKQNGLSWDLDICLSIRREIEDLKELQRFWVPYVSGYKEFEVFSGNERYVVDLNQRACGCRSWQLTGIPCVHAVSAISSLNLDVEAFVSNSYTKASFLSSYEYNIHPLNDSSEWPHVEGLHTILPPLKRRLPGRPCVKRKRDQEERELSGHTRHTMSRAGIPLRCTICHQTGHNKATCPSKPTPAPTTACPSHLTPDSSTAGPSHVKKAPVKKVPVKKAPMKMVLVKKGPVKRSPMKKVPLNDVGRVRKFSERITEIGIQKNVKVKDGTGCSQDKLMTLE